MRDQVAQYLLQEARIDEAAFLEMSGAEGVSTSGFLRKLLADDLLDAEELVGLICDLETTAREGQPRREPGDASPPEFGRYELDPEALGEGGMGRVLAGTDRLLGRRVAIKVLHANPHYQMLRRFVREARLTGRLSHPNIILLHDFGVSGDGQPYFAMKEVIGQTLQSAYPERPAPEALPARLEVFGKICDAMAYAHAQGVIHRDLKPANVMVGQFGEVQVMDWGLARTIDGESSGIDSSVMRRVAPDVPEALPDGDLTEDGVVVGTPRYMAPEQARGEVETIDARADVHALGGILYMLTAGVPPFAGLQPKEVLYRLLRGELEPPRSFNPELPEELEAIVLAAMARHRHERYQAVVAMRDDVRAFLDGRPVSVFSYTGGQVLRKWAARNRLLAATLLVVGTALVVGAVASIGFGVWAGRSVAREADAARRQGRAEQVARGASDRARAQFLAAQRRAEEFRSLSDTTRIDRLLAQAVEHGPQGWKVPGMRAWVTEAARLLERAAQHEALLARLERAATTRPLTDVEQWHRRLLSGFPARLERLREALPRARAAILEAPRWKRALRSHAAQWRHAIAAIRRSPRYGGLVLAPQEGLLPLGPDPESGLWEFAHLPSGTPPRRDGKGRLALSARHGVVLVLLPGGEVRTGASRRWPDPMIRESSPSGRHRLAPFFISKYELTVAQKIRLSRGLGPGQKRPSGPLLNPANFRAARPQRLLGHAGLRLPTEVEWEYAARAGTRTPWWTGSTPETLEGAANIRDQALRRVALRLGKMLGRDAFYAPWDDGYHVAAPVGRFRANPFGLHDVIGNMPELCTDSWPSAQSGATPGLYNRGGQALTPAWWATVYRRQSLGFENGVRPVREIVR